jgi:hypothetical protein
MNRINVALLTVMSLSTSVLLGCTPPYPTHKHTVAPAGIVRNVPDPSSVKPGISQRDGVLNVFKEVDTRVSSPWFFWGRWESSSVAMRVLTDSGLEQVPMWSLKNFLVEFDDTGTVTKTAMPPDSRIISELERVLAEHPQPTETTSPPLVLTGNFSPRKRYWCHSNIVVSPSTIEFSAPGIGLCSFHVNLPMQGLTVDSYAASTGEGTNIKFLRFTLRSSGKTPVGSGIPVSLKPSDLVLFLRFLQASRQASQRDSINKPSSTVLRILHGVGDCPTSGKSLNCCKIPITLISRVMTACSLRIKKSCCQGCLPHFTSNANSTTRSCGWAESHAVSRLRFDIWLSVRRCSDYEARPLVPR